MRLAHAAGCLLGSVLMLTASSASAQARGTSFLIVRGDAALRAGDSISSLSLYREAVGRAPRDVAGYLALGNGYLAVNEPKHALEVFEAGVRNTRGSEPLSLGLARCYAALGFGEQALLVLRQLANNAGGSRALYEALAERAEASGAFVEALAARRAVLSKLRAVQDAHEEDLRLARTRVTALELLLAGADRLARGSCQERGPSQVIAALLGCPGAP